MSPIKYDPKANDRRVKRRFLDDARRRVSAHPPFHQIVRTTILMIVLATAVGAAVGYFLL